MYSCFILNNGIIFGTAIFSFICNSFTLASTIDAFSPILNNEWSPVTFISLPVFVLIL